MSEIRLHEGELNIMELLWSNKVLAAKDISKIIKEYIGWEKNTTYTVIKRLLNKFYNGSLNTFFTEFLKNQKLSASELLEMERIISEQKL